MPRVLIFAEHGAQLASLEASLRGKADLRIIGGDPPTLVRLIEQHAPTVVVLASTAARVLASLKLLSGGLGGVPLIVLTDDPHAIWTPAARRAGVHGVLDRDAPAEQITAAIVAAGAGLIALPPDLLRHPLRQPADDLDERALTPREREILEMLAEGLSNRRIARRLGISSYTVKFHVASILSKLRASSRTEAVTLGVRRGLVSL